MSLTFDAQGRLQLDAREQAYLAGHFTVLARNRQDFQLQERDQIRISKSKLKYHPTMLIASPNKAGANQEVTFKPHISEKSERLGDSTLKNKLKDFKGSHADYLISEAMRIKFEREKLAKFKEDQEMRALQQKPDISSK